MSERKRIAVVHAIHDGIESLYTGVGRIARNVCEAHGEVERRALGGSGSSLHFVTVNYPRTSPAFRRQILDESIEVVERHGGTLTELATPTQARTANDVWGGPARWRRAGHDAAEEAMRIANGHERTIVFAHDIMFASMLPALAMRTPAARFVAVWVPHSTSRIHKYGRVDHEREIIECETAQVIKDYPWALAGAVGEFMAQHMADDFRIPMDKQVRLKNGILRSSRRYPRFSKEQAASVLTAAGVPTGVPLTLFFGRCVPHKGADLVLDAFAQAARPAHLLFIAPTETGDDAYLDELARKAEALGERATAVFHFDELLPFAALSHQDTVSVVVPSRADPCPLAVMEAKLYSANSAFVIITSKVDGLAEQAVTGATFQVDLSVDALATAIDRAAGIPERQRRQMARAAHESLADWDFVTNHSQGLTSLLGRTAKLAMSDGDTL